MPEPRPGDASHEQRLGTVDAVVVGLGAMLGAGVFAAFGPAARAAGGRLVTNRATRPACHTRSDQSIL